jgi:hypothetical protein
MCILNRVLFLKFYIVSLCIGLKHLHYFDVSIVRKAPPWVAETCSSYTVFMMYCHTL